MHRVCPWPCCEKMKTHYNLRESAQENQKRELGASSAIHLWCDEGTLFKLAGLQFLLSIISVNRLLIPRKMCGPLRGQSCVSLGVMGSGRGEVFLISAEWPQGLGWRHQRCASSMTALQAKGLGEGWGPTHRRSQRPRKAPSLYVCVATQTVKSRGHFSLPLEP